MTTWFTADTHFGHANIIRYSRRPFDSVQAMDAALTANWNRVVRPSDAIYHLGDFTLAGPETAAGYFGRLNGRIAVVPGGHDRRWLKQMEYHSKSGAPVEILPPLVTLKLPVPGLDQAQLVVLCHYAMRVWDRSHYGSWHLFGHSHGNLPPWKNSLDVGVDCWDYQPVSIEMVNTAMRSSPAVSEQGDEDSQ